MTCNHISNSNSNSNSNLSFTVEVVMSEVSLYENNKKYILIFLNLITKILDRLLDLIKGERLIIHT